MELYDPEMIQVGFRCDLLNVFRIGILDIDHILSAVLEPADQHEVTKGPGVRWRLCRNAFFSRLRRLNNRSGIGWWVRGDCSLLSRHLGRNIAARDVRGIGARVDGPRVACIDNDNNRVTAAGRSGGFRLYVRGRSIRVLVVVIRLVIQIGVVIRIAESVPIKRPDRLLEKNTTVATKGTAILTECEVVSATEIATAKPAARGRLRGCG